MNLLSILLKSMLSDGALNALAKRTGINASKLTKLIPLALPLLLKFMTRNASSQTGALSLLGALSQHTNTKSMPEQLDEADEEDGQKIIRHIMGDDTDNAVISLAQETGMSDEEVTRALGGLAPALLSGLSAAASAAAKPANKPSANTIDLSDGLDLGDVMAMLNGGNSAPAQNNSMSLLGSLLGGGAAPVQQPQQQANPLGGLLGSLLGSNTAPVQQPQQQANPLGDLLGSLLGGGAAPVQQPQPQADPLSGLLGSLFGGSAAPVQQPQPQMNPLGGLLGSMLGAAPSANDNTLNGNALLSTLAALMK